MLNHLDSEEKKIEKEKSEVKSAETIYEKIGKNIIFLLFFLTPIFFLPFTFYPVSLSKQLLVIFLVVIGFVLFLIQGLIHSKFSFPKTRLNTIVLSLLGVIFLSFLFSQSKAQSFFGHENLNADSFLNFLIYGSAFFLAGFFIKKKEDVLKCFFVFLISLGFLSIFTLLQWFGILKLSSIFNQGVADINPIGANLGLGFFLAFGLVVILSVLNFLKLNKLWKIIFSLIGILVFLELLAINYWLIWLGICLALILIINFKLSQEKGISKGIGLNLLIIFLILIFWIFKPLLPNLINFSPEISLPFNYSWDIFLKTFSDIKTILLGSGPATFAYDYSLFRSPDLINVMFYWSNPPILTYLMTFGVLGFFSILALIFFFFYSVIKAGMQYCCVSTAKTQQCCVSTKTFFVLGFFLFFFWIFSPGVFTLYLFTFLILGLLVSILSDGKFIKTREISFLNSPFKVFINLGAIFLIICLIVLFSLITQKYIGAIYFERGIKEFNSTQNLDQIADKLSQASKLDKLNDRYFLNLSQVYLLKIKNTFSDQNLSQDQKTQQSQLLVQKTIDNAKKATQLNSNQVLNWGQLGFIYENLILLSSDNSEDFAKEAYEKAMKLDPQNFQYQVSLANVYLLSGMKAGIASNQEGLDEKKKKEFLQLKEKKFDQSLKYLDKVIQVKKDYSAAYFLMVQVYEQKGKINEAIKKLEELKTINSFDSQAAFQLGLLYYQAQKVNLAQKELERAVGIDPNYSNARYYLGLIYSENGEREKAIREFEKIKQLNPESQEVKKILENLKAKKKPFGETTSTIPSLD